MGIQWTEDQVVAWLGNNISSARGLEEGSGRMLAKLFQHHGLSADYGPLTWDRAEEIAGRQPFCMSGGVWYHWSAVRDKDESGLRLANPMPSHAGVGDHLEPDEWRGLGGWNAAWVNLEPIAPRITHPGGEDQAMKKNKSKI